MIRLILVAMAIALTGCASLPPAQQFNFEGNKALEAKNYQLAREQYQKALVEAQQYGDPQYVAIAMYGLARANGYLCNFKEAEGWFHKSISLRETLPDSGIASLSQNILELARLYAAQQKWKEVLVQFERAIPLVERMGIETRDPIGYADVLEDYKNALRATGNTKKAMKIEEKIRYLRSTHPSRHAVFKIRPYPTNCSPASQS